MIMEIGQGSLGIMKQLLDITIIQLHYDQWSGKELKWTDYRQGQKASNQKFLSSPLLGPFHAYLMVGYFRKINVGCQAQDSTC